MIKTQNVFKYLLFSVMLLLSSFSFAEQSQVNTIADIKGQLISSMEKDGYLSKKMASEVAQKYISEADKQTVSKPIAANDAKVEQAKVAVKEASTVKWTDYLSLSNFLKVVGIICFLFFFSGIIKTIVLGLWVFIVAVPVIVYQSVFLVAGIFGIFRPDLIWQAESFYVALFFAFANIITVGWIIETHESLKKIIAKLFKLGLHPSCVASFYGMIYFGILALVYQSSIFGFFAAVCLSGIFSFGLYYMPGVLFLHFKDSMMPALIFGHLIVLGAYTFFMKLHPELTMYFDSGIQYYCTVALGVGLLVAASPFYKRSTALLYATLFIILFFVAAIGYHLYDMKVVGSILIGFFILTVLEWIGYVGYRSGAIIGSAIIGGSLYGTAMLLEKYGSMVVLTLNQ